MFDLPSLYHLKNNCFINYNKQTKETGKQIDMQNSLEGNLEYIEGTQTQSLLRYITNFGKSVIKYTGCKEIAEILDTTEPSSPDDIELIAKSLVVEDINKITVYDLLLYSQIVIALRKANCTEL